MIKALKENNKIRKNALSSVISAIKNNAINAKIKDNIPDSIVDSVLLKEKKTLKEMIDTCPADRTDLLNEYNERLSVVEEFCPTVIEDSIEIKNLILSTYDDISTIKQNRSKIMKELKGKVDMKIANQVIGEMI
jgi:hypothetical protein